MIPVADQTLQKRLEASGIAYAATAAALTALPMNGRNKLGVITPAADAEKTASLLFEAIDEGRHVQGCNIVRMRLRITHRVNVKAAGGAEEVTEPQLKALETLLDANIKVALDAPALGIAVMMATRRPGRGRRTVGDIREHLFEIEVRAVAMENTTAGLSMPLSTEAGDTITTEAGDAITTES